MKITKEKAIYFLSLNLVTFSFVSFFYYSAYSLEGGSFVESMKFVWHGISFYFFPIFMMNVISFLYSCYTYIKKKKFSVIMGSVLASLPIFMLLIFYFFDEEGIESINEFLWACLISFIIYLIMIPFNLVVLAITNPLRKKIEW